ncbi:MAG: hypothetical protein ACO3R5_09620 [Pseudohongiellaceae bacterium]
MIRSTFLSAMSTFTRFTVPAMLAVSLLISWPAQAQWFDWDLQGIPRLADGRVDMTAPVPRTFEGKPDFTGTWVPMDATGSIFDRDSYQGWALDTLLEQETTFFVNDPRFNCLPDGPASWLAGTSVGGTRKIVQTPDFIAVLNPDMTYRQIHLDGREPVQDALLPNWLGYSVGHWEGDTLVVESAGFNDRTWLTREGLPHTDQLRLTETYRRLDFGHVELVIDYVDPGALTRPLQAVVTLEYRADNHILEIVCNESETAQSHYSGALTQAEAKVVEVPESVLATYVGTYQGIWLGRNITAEVYLEDGELYLTRTPRYSDTGGNTDSATSLLVPQSENAFDSIFGLGWVFNKNADGEVESVSEVHVSGAWPFMRVE